MKPIFLTVLSLFILSACSSDDDKKSANNPDPAVSLLKRSIETFYDENETIISDYEYSGNRLTKITFSNDPYYPPGSYELYHYTDNLLTSTEFFISNELIETKAFEYNSQDKLISLITQTNDDDDDTAEKTTYTYNNDGTIGIEKYTIYIDGSNSFEELTATGRLTLNNGNITKCELDYITGEKTIENYTYDKFNSPFKNVFLNDILTLVSLQGGPNNVLSYNFIQDNQEQYSNSKTIQYNQLNYPIKENESGIKREYIYY